MQSYHKGYQHRAQGMSNSYVNLNNQMMINQIIFLKANSLATHQWYEFNNKNVKETREPDDPVIFQQISNRNEKLFFYQEFLGVWQL